MAYSIAQLNALQAAAASGHLEVQYADKKIKYQTLTEMRSLIAEMRAALIASGELSEPANNRPTTSVAQFTRE